MRLGKSFVRLVTLQEFSSERVGVGAILAFPAQKNVYLQHQKAYVQLVQLKEMRKIVSLVCLDIRNDVVDDSVRRLTKLVGNSHVLEKMILMPRRVELCYIELDRLLFSTN